MATKKTGIIVGIVAVAVIGIVAIFYSQRQPAERDATGAIGAAERYRAEQITDEDVILDIPGQDELAAAVYAVMTDEQKAELLGRMGEEGRRQYYDRYADPEMAFGKMSAEQQGRYVQSLDLAAQARVAEALRIEAADLARMDPETLGRAMADLDARTRSEAIGRFDPNEAFGQMTALQRGYLVLALDRAAKQRVVNNMKFEVDDLGRIDPDALGRAVGTLDAKTRSEAIGRFDASAFERMSPVQQAYVVLALDREAQQRVANALRIEVDDLGRIDPETLGRAMADLDARTRSEAIGRFDPNEAFGQMTALQRGYLVLALDRAAKQRVVNNMKFEVDDLGRIDPDALGRAVGALDAKTRSEAIGRFDASAFERMSPVQQAYVVLALDREAQQRVANALSFKAEDLARIDAGALGRALASMDAEARARAIGRVQADEGAYARWSVAQKAAFADALGAKAFESTILQARAWNALNSAQRWAAWTNLGRQGQEAALRYAGVSSAELERSDAHGRTLDYLRITEQARNAEHGAATRD